MQRRDFVKFSTMLGFTAVSTSVSQAIAAGVSTSSGPIKSQYAFTTNQRTAVLLLSEMIIPTTDTPGAIAAGVPDFIERIYADWYQDNERKRFDLGLAELDEFCKERDGKAFATATLPTRIAALQYQEQKALDYTKAEASPPASNADEDSPFFLKIKELVVLGYYTSNIGSTQEMEYRPMPMAYDGDVDLTATYRLWSY